VCNALVSCNTCVNYMKHRMPALLSTCMHGMYGLYSKTSQHRDNMNSAVVVVLCREVALFFDVHIALKLHV